VIEERIQPLLQNLIRREGRSFLQYVGEAFPWATREERGGLATLAQLIREEREAIAALSRFLVKHRVTPPYLGAYPTRFTTINFVALDHLLPLLVEHQQRSIADLERDLAQITEPHVKEEVQKILEMKRRHLETLKTLAAAPAPQKA
jgi:hypothetical protein